MPASLSVPYLNMVERLSQSQTDIDQAVLSVLHSGQFIAGPYRSLCEKAVSKLVGLPFAVGVGSGTSALKMALQALGVGPGDEVILPAISFVATFESIAQTGATPVVVDVQSNRPLISNLEIEKAITKKTKAIVPVHLYGNFASVESFGLPTVDDAAQALGSCPISHGTLTTLSFYPTKIIGGIGDGGMVLCQSKEMADQIRALGHHGVSGGQQSLVRHGHMPGNDRMDEIQAAAIVAQLPDLRRRVTRRQQISEAYDHALQHWKPFRNPASNASIYAFCHPEREKLKLALSERGIGTAIYYDTPLSQHPLNPHPKACPNAEIYCRQTLALPCHAGMNDKELDYVVSQLKTVLKLL